jgi:hypothetical protein
MTISFDAPIPQRPREFSEWIALAVIGFLLLVEVTYLGLGMAARNLVIAVGEYKLDRYVEEEWLLATAHQEARAAFQVVMPEFRQHKPEVDIRPRRVLVTVLVRGNIDVRPIFELVGQRLDDQIRKHEQVTWAATTAQLSNIEFTPYSWFKPLDLVSLVVLLGAGAVWVVFP